ncbi:MAG: alanine dehydrogenase [Proteobacteria bacterium]|nr:alanine dehydrogenase [Pseudomonadota bacterium]NIS69406.1 alanine dehydrogenase [Pseudomonadota bacterium]
MIIGIPTEVKKAEHRVGIVPAGVKALVSQNHKVIIQKGAGLDSGITDQEYRSAGATIMDKAGKIYDDAEMIMKVKEPLPEEYPLLHEGQILYTYLHLAPALELTKALLERKVVGLAYETIQLEDGSLPLLTPMSEIAGRMSIQVGAYYLQKEHGGRGVLLGGVPGVAPGNVAIIGGGTVGTNAAKMAVGIGAKVTILDINLERLRYLDDIFGSKIVTLMSDSHNIEETVTQADLVIGAVLIPGARAPRLVSRQMLSDMQNGSVIVDVAVDQGGCIETIHPTYHDNPTYEVDGIIHYGVANMPGAVARTSTFALTNTTLPYALRIANLGWKGALRSDESLLKGLNVVEGSLICKPVGEALGMACVAVDEVVG